MIQRILRTTALVLMLVTSARSGTCRGTSAAEQWVARLLAFPYREVPATNVTLQLLRQDYEELTRNQSILNTPLTLGSRVFAHGLGTHAVAHLRVVSPDPIDSFAAWVGVDRNVRTHDGQGSVVFSVVAGGRELYRSPTLRGGQDPARAEVSLGGVTTLDVHVSDADDGPSCDHADLAEAEVSLRSGKTIRLDEMPVGLAPWRGSAYPFSFTYGGKVSDELLSGWTQAAGESERGEGSRGQWRSWQDPVSGLRVRWESRSLAGFAATEWILVFENTGNRDTAIVENIQALDLTLSAPLNHEQPYRLHRSKGAPADPTDFEPSVVALRKNQTERLGAGGGRSSNRDFPFFKIEMGEGSLIIAVGWSGQWAAALQTLDGRHLRVTGGMEKTHFRLRPGEKVRSPRLLVLFEEGDTWEANAQFRQLIYRHYAAKRSGRDPMPTLFCNTCFTRGGGWLNECNASNQISLIRAYRPLGLEALITDAGWFEGGWPAGAGNWTPRQDAYPDGMAPVARAAQAHGMVYGLWFEPERVIAGTVLHRQHPDWCLTDGAPGQTTLLADFGRREVQDYFFNIVKGFMDLPGFGFYRQDFNMDPLAYWRHHDAPDRQGITEIRYVEGLYAYWDRLASAWPDSLREECASGGRRIDLETLRRMPLHQKSDYWFDSDVDQASLWSLSQYLPNNLVTVPLTRLDDYSFHSTLASSLIPAWIADAPGFDDARAKRLLDRYRAVRHLLVGAWYPLLPYSRSPRDWMGSQFHRADLGEGMVLAFRRAESPYPAVEVVLRGLEAATTYEVTFDGTGEQRRARGAELMKPRTLTLPSPHRSELIVYRKVGD